MDEEFSMPEWNPLVVYIDCWGFSTSHNPVKWLGKSIKALADWFIARREIKSILLVPINNLTNLINVDAATAVKDTLNFVDKLTGDVKYQGDIGEKLLCKLLEIHGLQINTDFIVQEGNQVYKEVNDEILQRVRPDVILNLSESF